MNEEKELSKNENVSSLFLKNNAVANVTDEHWNAEYTAFGSVVSPLTFARSTSIHSGLGVCVCRTVRMYWLNRYEYDYDTHYNCSVPSLRLSLSLSMNESRRTRWQTLHCRVWLHNSSSFFSLFSSHTVTTNGYTHREAHARYARHTHTCRRKF